MKQSREVSRGIIDCIFYKRLPKGRQRDSSKREGLWNDVLVYCDCVGRTLNIMKCIGIIRN